MLSLSRLACLLGVLALAGSATAQSVSNATPTSAAVGTTLTINGSGFGTAKPKVQLFNAATNKKFVLKVLTNSDTQITASITKAVVGDLALQVFPKGFKVPIANEPTITIERPLVTSLSTSSSDPDGTFTVFGDFFGTKKGKVNVGTATAKVINWTNTQIQLTMPKKLFNGLHFIKVDNKLGFDDSSSITMTNSPEKLGEAGLTLTIKGSAFKPKIVQASLAGGVINIVAVSVSNPSKNLTMMIPFNPAVELAPKLLTSGPFLNLNYIETNKITGFVFPVPAATWSASGLGVGTPNVHITASTGGQVAGTVNSTLVLFNNDTGKPQPTSVPVTGTFIIDL